MKTRLKRPYFTQIPEVPAANWKAKLCQPFERSIALISLTGIVFLKTAFLHINCPDRIVYFNSEGNIIKWSTKAINGTSSHNSNSSSFGYKKRAVQVHKKMIPRLNNKTML